ncbi:DUF4856 domain-containing protein [Echinicola pacifica]|uniref:DUF4856 domain-containing protein n=1 Tax=Echinicola pacifica TaxID=346377 RepID=A0A918PMZ6_9BACT|nr:DUF4856 domain-containing protein [Echinicola pacifica]GGZ16074.1 DUF4856 domain-containing protein [Echinicola pacifica]
MKKSYLPFLGLAMCFFACSETEETPSVQVPTTYEFERNGSSSVYFQGQTDRLDMLSELKSYLAEGNAGMVIEASKLLSLYSNANAPFASAALNESGKQLENKTNPADIEFIKSLLVQAAEVSKDVATNNTQAAEGVAGAIERGTSGKIINVTEKGWEFTEFIEKGVMGSVFYHQIFNVYLSESKTGDDVDNVNLEDGANYTPMEHHWDEAFGYWGVPVDFPNGDPVLDDAHKRYWASYTNGRDALLDINTPLMNAYITGRAAIVAKNNGLKNAQKPIIIGLHELVAAATAVHYINNSMNSLSTGDTGSLFHTLSEAYGFIKAIGQSPNKQLSQANIDEILNSDFGTEGDFWTITMDGLHAAKDKLTRAYPSLKNVEDEL